MSEPYSFFLYRDDDSLGSVRVEVVCSDEVALTLAKEVLLLEELCEEAEVWQHGRYVGHCRRPSDEARFHL